MGPVNSAWVHCTQLTCQQLRAEPKKKRKKRKEKRREMRNTAVNVESKHILCGKEQIEWKHHYGKYKSLTKPAIWKVQVPRFECLIIFDLFISVLTSSKRLIKLKVIRLK